MSQSDATLAAGQAGGKAILLGEHAVVYGSPAVAIPVPGLAVEVTLLEGAGWDLDPDIDAHRAALERARDAQLAALDWPGAPPRIRVRGTLPASCGLGSSAALSVALARALLAATASPEDDRRVGELADASERVFHDRPSGVDVATVLAGVPIRFQHGQPTRTVRPGRRTDLWVVDTGVRSRTADVVSDVARQRDREPRRFDEAMVELVGAAGQGCQALEGGDLAGLGKAMARAMVGLRAMDVSHEAIEDVIREAELAGALGAKLSGAGRGGIVLLLGRDPSWQPPRLLAGQPVLARVVLSVQCAS